MGQPIVHFEVNAKDGKRAQTFYSNLFKWNINADNPMNYGLVNTGSKKGIAGGIGQVDKGKSPYVTFYIEVDNPQSYLDRAVGLGGKVVMPVTEVPNMVTFAQFADPDGNVVGLVKSMQPPPARKPMTRVKKATPSRKR